MLAAVEIHLDKLVEDQVFEQSAAQIMQSYLTFFANTQQGTSQTGVIKVELGRLDQAFAEVLIVRL